MHGNHPEAGKAGGGAEFSGRGNGCNCDWRKALLHLSDSPATSATALPCYPWGKLKKRMLWREEKHAK